eukprot:1649312-Amphidinium_carterae.1
MSLVPPVGGASVLSQVSGLCRNFYDGELARASTDKLKWNTPCQVVAEVVAVVAAVVVVVVVVVVVAVAVAVAVAVSVAVAVA